MCSFIDDITWLHLIKNEHGDGAKDGEIWLILGPLELLWSGERAVPKNGLQNFQSFNQEDMAVLSSAPLVRANKTKTLRDTETKICRAVADVPATERKKRGNSQVPTLKSLPELFAANLCPSLTTSRHKHRRHGPNEHS